MLERIPVRWTEAILTPALAVILASGIVFSGGPARAQNQNVVEAPFRLSWGWHERDFAKHRISIKYEKRTESGGKLFWVRNPPKNIKDTGRSGLLITITDRYGLQRVTWTSIIFYDVLGSAAKARYAELKSAVTQKYGSPNSYEWLSKRKNFDHLKNQFYRCMSLKRCGNWSSYWTKNVVGGVGLKIVGFKGDNPRNGGWVRLEYDGPMFSRYLRERPNPPNSKDADAL
jgi:hypothetical protein